MRRLMLGEQRAQRTAAQMFLYIVVRQLAQAKSAQRRIEHCTAAVAAPVALHSHRYFTAGFEKGPGIAAADQAVVAGQFGQAVGGAMVFEIRRCCAQEHPPGRQAGGYQAGVLQPAKTDRQVELTMQQIEGLVGQGHLDAQAGVLLQEVVDQRHDEFLAVGH